MEMPPPNTAVFEWNSMCPLAFICVLSSVIPPPTFPKNVLFPVNIVGNLKAAIALVSLLTPTEVLLRNVLERERERERERKRERTAVH